MVTATPTDRHPEDTPALGHARPPKLAGRHVLSVAFFLCAALSVLTADLVSKQLAFENVAPQPVVLNRLNGGNPMVIPPHEPIVVVPGLLSLRLTTNTGAVFGLGKGGQWVFVAVSLVAIVVIGRVFWFSEAGAWRLHLPLGLILGGALGNLYDRICFNAVRDLLWLFPDAGLWPWIFNVADASLLVGVTMMVAVMWWNDRHHPTPEIIPD